MKCTLFPDSYSKEPEDSSLSPYELARQKRIEENREMCGKS